MKKSFGLLVGLLFASSAYGQTSPGFVPGQVLGAAELNAAFASKQDFPGGGGTAVIALPTSINLGTIGPVNDGSNYTSPLQTGSANTVLVWSVRATQDVTISLQRYLDTAGTIPQGALISTLALANVQTQINTFDGLPFMSFRVSIANASGGIATIMDYALIVTLQTGRALWHTTVYTVAATYTYVPVTGEVLISGCGGGGGGGGGQVGLGTAGGGGGGGGVSIHRRGLPATTGNPLTIIIPGSSTGGGVGANGQAGQSITITGGLIPFQTINGGNAGLAGGGVTPGVGGLGVVGVFGGGSAGAPATVGGNSVLRGVYLEAPPGSGSGANTGLNGVGSGISSFAVGVPGGGTNGGGGGAPSGYGNGGVPGGNGLPGAAPTTGFCGGGGGGGSGFAGGAGGPPVLIIEEMY